MYPCFILRSSILPNILKILDLMAFFPFKNDHYSECVCDCFTFLYIQVCFLNMGIWIICLGVYMFWTAYQCYYMLVILKLLAFFLILYLWDFVHVDMYISVHITFNCSVLSHCINKPQLIYLSLLLMDFCIDLSLSLYSFLLLPRNGI